MAEGAQVTAQEWEELWQIIHDVAEGYAATDPNNGYLYRDEANQFRRLNPPADADGLAERHKTAAELRQLWQHRFVKTAKRKP